MTFEEVFNPASGVTGTTNHPISQGYVSYLGKKGITLGNYSSKKLNAKGDDIQSSALLYMALNVGSDAPPRAKQA